MSSRAVVSAEFQHTASALFVRVMFQRTLLTARYVVGKEEDFKQTSDQSPETELCIRWSWNIKDDDFW